MNARVHRRLLGLAAIATTFLLIGSSALHAQRWQDIFASGSCTEFGARGVQHVAAGGYIAAGWSSSPIPACNGQNVYVVRTDDNGGLVWSNTYDIGGGNSQASCVRECANGDFIVTGISQNANACCCEKDNIFLMRLDPNGNVRWVKSYGATGSEVSYSVIEATTGNGVQTKAGDFIVCGSAPFAGSTVSGGYIFRTTAGGKLIWDQTYLGFNNQPMTYFDVDETQVVSAGSILACGEITSPTGNLAMYIRVNGNDGTLMDGPILWPGGTSASAYSIKELQLTNPGDIAITGVTNVGGNANAFIARFPSATGCPFPSPATVAQYYTGPSGAPSAGRDIQEVSSGNLVVAGMAIGYPGGPGSADVMMIEVDPNTLNYAGSGFNLYGGPNRDEGFSVAEANPVLPGTPGFIITGYSGSFTAPGTLGLYLIKTDVAGSSNCNSVNLIDASTTFPLVPKCFQTALQSINAWCTPPYTADPQVWQNQLCYINPAAHRGENPSNGASDVPNTHESPIIPLKNDATLSSYPNPVRKGTSFKLEYEQAQSGHVTIDVVDVSGKIIYTTAGEYPAGSSQIELNTDGWPSGAYMIRLSTNGASATQRVTIIDK